jgi:hypothetical protein
VRRGAAPKASSIVLFHSTMRAGVGLVDGSMGVEAGGSLGLDKEPPDKVCQNGKYSNTSNHTTCNGASVWSVIFAVVATTFAAVRRCFIRQAESFGTFTTALDRVGTRLALWASWAD